MFAALLTQNLSLTGAVATSAAATLFLTCAYYCCRLLKERRNTQELSALRSALDQVDIAVALIDPDFRARFLNRTYRRVFRVPDDLAEKRPTLTALLEHKFDQRVYEISSDKQTYVTERLALIRAGDEQPIDLRLANGDVMRFRCKALADGGWMLNYGNVSDLVHTADELAELAKTDGLTGAYNRRYFFAKLDEEWSRHQRHGRPLSVLILDLDRFKSVNDSFGHEAGDHVIKRVAALCVTAKRDSDTFARLGGEEFGFLLPETSLDEACRLAERVRATIGAEHWSTVPGVTKATASIGAAEAGSLMNSPADLIRHADKALYAAKRAGRNRVAVIERESNRAASASAA